MIHIYEEENKKISDIYIFSVPDCRIYHDAGLIYGDWCVCREPFWRVGADVCGGISDHWLFFGLQAKESEKAEFLKTSGVGIEIMQDALILDLVRKFLTAIGIIAAGYLLPGLSGGFLYMVLVSYVFSVLGTFLSRYGGTLLINICIAQSAMLFVVVCLLCMLRQGLLKFMFGMEDALCFGLFDHVLFPWCLPLGYL